MEKVLKSFFLALGRHQGVGRWAKRYGLRLGARRFVAGESIEQAIETVRRLNASGRMATLDYLGEFTNDAGEAREAAEMCLKTLDAIHASGVQANLSLKLTSLGLDLEPKLCEEALRGILRRAAEYGIFVRIDMEDHTHCQPALDMLKKLRVDYDNIGIVIQAYLYRSEDDVKELGERHTNLRLVKGAYKEPDTVAFPRKEDVDANLIRLIESHLNSGSYTAIASHDERIIQHTKEFVRKQGIPYSRFEFQMLYGICEELQLRLVQEGYRFRVYVPFGVDWFGYFMRRLAERPANVWFVLKNMFR